MGQRCRAGRGDIRPSRPRVGRGPPPQRRRQYAGDPRRIQRRTAEGHGISRRHGAGSPLVCAVSCARRCSVVRGSRRRATQGRRQRVARLQARRSRPWRRGQGALLLRGRVTDAPLRRAGRAQIQRRVSRDDAESGASVRAASHRRGRPSSTTTSSTARTPGRTTSTMPQASPASPPTSSPRRERLRRPQAATVIS